MWLFLDKKRYRCIHNVIVPASDGTTQIDHVVISVYGVFVIETKNMMGWIFGRERDERWCQSIYGKKFHFQNPLRQNYRHTRCLADFLDIPHELLHSIVIFVGDCEFKTQMPMNVMRGGLGSYIRQFQQPCIAPATVKAIEEKLLALKKTSVTLSAHVQSLHERHNSSTSCPKCGEPLVTRTAKRGANAGNEFLGCSSYPKCRYTRDAGSLSREHHRPEHIAH